MNEKITYTSEIITAFELLDGTATLSEINIIIEKRDMLPYIHTNKNWKDNIRATIQRHCSQTKSYRGAEDLFYSVYGLGEGIWGLKSFATIEAEITSFESRKINEVTQDNTLNTTEKETIILARKGQGKFRKDILSKFHKCVITNIENPNLLIASHIKPWRSSNNYERLSCENGLALSPLYDKLFDLGYISFDKNTRIIVSQKLSNSDIRNIDIDTEQIYLPSCSNEMKQNIEYHNDKIFRR